MASQPIVPHTLFSVCAAIAAVSAGVAQAVAVRVSVGAAPAVAAVVAQTVAIGVSMGAMPGAAAAVAQAVAIGVCVVAGGGAVVMAAPGVHTLTESAADAAAHPLADMAVGGSAEGQGSGHQDGQNKGK